MRDRPKPAANGVSSEDLSSESTSSGGVRSTGTSNGGPASDRGRPLSERTRTGYAPKPVPGNGHAGVCGNGPTTGFDSTDRSTDAAIVETGTTTVGIAGSDGVVLAADTRASIGGGRFVTNRSMRKVESIDDGIAVAFSGSVSDAQSFVRRLRAEARLYRLEHGEPMAVETTATVAGDLVRRGPYRVLDLVLAGVGDEPAVYDVGPGGGVMATPYAAAGSGMQLAYGALEGAIGDGRSLEESGSVGDRRPVEELRTIAARAIESATARDTASGDGMTVATITGDGVSMETIDEIGPGAIDAEESGPDATGAGAPDSDAADDEEVR